MTSAQPLRFAAAVVVGAFFVSPLAAETRRVGGLIFDDTLYPGLSSRTDDELRLAGIAALYPGRVQLGETPSDAPAVETRKPLVLKIAGGVEYVRPYGLTVEELVSRVGKVPLIVDCRYLTGGPESLAEALRFGGVLAGGATPRLERRGDYVSLDSGLVAPDSVSAKSSAPVLVLVNEGTAGPVEAVLDALQRARLVELVGTGSAGRTGKFSEQADRPRVLIGELLAAGGESLVGRGVAPAHRVEVDPKSEFLVWQLLGRGASVASLIGKESAAAAEVSVPPTGEQGAAPAGAPGLQSRDVVLRRAVDLHEALRVLSQASSNSSAKEVRK